IHSTAQECSDASRENTVHAAGDPHTSSASKCDAVGSAHVAGASCKILKSGSVSSARDHPEAAGQQFGRRLSDNEAGLVCWTDCCQFEKLREPRSVLTNKLTVAGGVLIHPFGVTEYKILRGPGYPD